MYPNPQYRRPSWEEVRNHLDTLGTARQKLVYLKRLLVTDEQEAEIRPERYWGFSESEESVSGWERTMAGGLEEYSDDDLAHFEEVAKRWRADVAKEISHFEEVIETLGEEGTASERPPLPERSPGEGEQVFWPGTQSELGAWLYITHRCFLGKTSNPYEPEVTFADFVRTACPLFYGRRKGKNEKVPFNARTIIDNAKGYAEKPEQAETILRRLSDAARGLKDADLGG